MKKILFLDFDGVLHAEDVYIVNGQPVLMQNGHRLFEHAELLAELLTGREDIDIVLSTTWVRVKGYDYAKYRLPESLQEKVIGSTYHSQIDRFWLHATRYEQIARYVQRHNVHDWLALDDDDDGWPDAMRHRLVHSDAQGGILSVRDNLVTKLEMF